MKLPGRQCPFGDGRHKLRPWAESGIARPRSGFACVQCSKTWEWKGDSLVETYVILKANGHG